MGGAMRKSLVAAGAVVVALGIAAAVGTMRPVEPAQPAESPKPTLGQWAAVYPSQYASFAVHDQKLDGQYHSHYDLRTKLLAPAARKAKPNGEYDTKLLAVDPADVDVASARAEGDLAYNTDGYVMVEGLEYDEATGRWYVAPVALGDLSATRERLGCFACKSTVFNEVYRERGAQIFNEPMDGAFVERLNGQIWDCETCHEAIRNDDGSWELDFQADARLTFWTQLSREAWDRFEPGERSCGQCHNSLDYRRFVTDQQTMDAFDPYRYGFGLDALYDAAMADGIYTVDEATGIRLSCLDHPEIELVQGSAMRALGVTCVDCHMPTTSYDAQESAFTSHNASGSPLESEDSLAFCLTCHRAQGIQTPEQMVSMVRDLQDQTAATAQALREQLASAYDLIARACQDPAADAGALQQCRDLYSRAEAYIHGTVGSVADEPLGTKIAHNPTAIASYQAQAKALLDQVAELLA